MKSRTLLLLAAAVAALTVLPGPAGAASKSKHRLQKFGSCSRFVHYARRHAINELRTRGVPAPAPLPVVRTPAPNQQTVQGEAAPIAGGDAGQDFSGTNVQEAGVDEPDVVKTDGKTIFTVANGDLQAVDARSPQPKLLQTLELSDLGQQLLLHGAKLFVIGTRYFDDGSGPPTPAPGGPAPAIAPVRYSYYRPITFLTEIDVSDPAAMKPLRSQTIEGSFVDARLVGDTARVVVTSPPAAFVPGTPDTVEKRISSTARNSPSRGPLKRMAAIAGAFTVN